MSVLVEILRETPPIYSDTGYPIEAIMGRRYVLDDEMASKLIQHKYARAVSEE
jgi:hypothetical protein